ncbi:MAG: YVTN family beta-propeller protein [Arenicella sp.]|jgi:YVTN family beta-propeller protein
MYRHTITIYNEDGDRLAKIRDGVNLKEYGFTEYEDHTYLGGPVEAAFTSDGKSLWVSNYSMVGPGFEHEGCDGCIGKDFDPSFLYKISCETFEIESVVKVGAVPKFIAISDDDSKLIVSNWTSSDISIVDLETEKEVKTVTLGSHPRGVDITADGNFAYVTIMGSTKLAEVNLNTYEVNYIKDIGRSPRHLILADHDSTIYVSMNSGSKVVKYNRFNHSKSICRTAAGPRSMCISENEDYLYCVNYFDHSFSKISTKTMEVIETIETAQKPIGICGNWNESEIWVACYSGKIEIFKDFHLDSLKNGNSIFGLDLSGFWPAKPKNLRKETEVEAETLAAELPDTNTRYVSAELVESIEVVPNVLQPKLYSDVKVVPPPTRFVRKIESSEDCTYYVICGSFSILENAYKRAAELDAKGYTCKVIKGSKLNYVAPSCFDSRELAEASMKQLKASEGYSAWILKR